MNSFFKSLPHCFVNGPIQLTFHSLASCLFFCFVFGCLLSTIFLRMWIHMEKMVVNLFDFWSCFREWSEGSIINYHGAQCTSWRENEGNEVWFLSGSSWSGCKGKFISPQQCLLHIYLYYYVISSFEDSCLAFSYIISNIDFLIL